MKLRLLTMGDQVGKEAVQSTWMTKNQLVVQIKQGQVSLAPRGRDATPFQQYR